MPIWEPFLFRRPTVSNYFTVELIVLKEEYYALLPHRGSTTCEGVNVHSFPVSVKCP